MSVALRKLLSASVYSYHVNVGLEDSAILFLIEVNQRGQSTKPSLSMAA